MTCFLATGFCPSVTCFLAPWVLSLSAFRYYYLQWECVLGITRKDKKNTSSNKIKPTEVQVPWQNKYRPRGKEVQRQAYCGRCSGRALSAGGAGDSSRPASHTKKLMTEHHTYVQLNKTHQGRNNLSITRNIQDSPGGKVHRRREQHWETVCDLSTFQWKWFVLPWFLCCIF
jgi:hypothetical protein